MCQPYRKVYVNHIEKNMSKKEAKNMYEMTQKESRFTQKYQIVQSHQIINL